MSNSCKDCQSPIDWNSKSRERLNTRRPLNPDGTIHSCNLRSRPSNTKPIPEPNDYPNPITGKPIIPNQQEDVSLETLTLEFQTLLKHTIEYVLQNVAEDGDIHDQKR